MKSIGISTRGLELLRRAVAPTAFAVLATGIGTATAAVSGHEIVTSSVQTVGSRQQRGKTVSCPPGKVATGGGVYISDDAPTQRNSQVTVNSSYPSIDGASWTAYVNNNVSPDSARFQVYAVCVAKLPGYTVRKTKAVVNPFDQEGHTTLCLDGTRVIGGGAYSYSSSPEVSMNSSFPVSDASSFPRGWGVYMNNVATGSFEGAKSFDVYAICAPDFGGAFVRTASGFSPSGTDTAAATASCSASEKLLGGGAFVASSRVLIDLNASYPASGTRWTSRLYNAQEDTRFTTYAICAGPNVPAGPCTGRPDGPRCADETSRVWCQNGSPSATTVCSFGCDPNSQACRSARPVVGDDGAE